MLAASLAMPVLMRGLTVTVPAAVPQLVKIERGARRAGVAIPSAGCAGVLASGRGVG